MKGHTCRDCGSEFIHDTGKAGRPPVRCESCREIHKEKKDPTKVKTSLSSIERVDRLEFMLKSRGQHPSQQTER